ncbi:MAG: rhodanese-like domain-containing protein [Fimbriimonas sp.]
MIIRNFYDEKLAQASYLVGCAATGEAIVIDPLRDIQQYLEMADAQQLHITAVTETHIHADYLSGPRELSAATGAKMYLSDEGDDTWKYAFANDPKVVLLKDSDVIRVGNLSLRAMHTPGHTPEHLVYILIDHPAGEIPHSMFSGDFIFAGDVGRPDLLERAADFAGTMEKAARVLFNSLQGLGELPDSLLIWPGHGAGSACGKSLGGSPVTSLGYERSTNWAFQVREEDKFVDEVLSGQPEPPVYFKEMKRLNKLGPTILNSLPHPQRVSHPNGRLVDVRKRDEIRGGVIPGALAIPFGKGLTNWAGWLLHYDEPVTLVAHDQESANQASRDLATIGLDVVSNWIKPTDLGSEFLPMKLVDAVDISLTDFVLDVRGANERKLTYISGSTHIPLGELPDRVDELPRDRRVVVHCASGGRSPISYSILQNAGLTNVAELAGGIEAARVSCPGLIAC